MTLEDDYKNLLNECGLETSYIESDVQRNIFAEEDVEDPVRNEYVQRMREMFPGIEDTVRPRTTSNTIHFDGGLDLAKMAFESKGEVFPSRVFFGEFPTGDLNACACPTPHGSLCLVNRGLIYLMHSIPQAACHPIPGTDLMQASNGIEQFEDESAGKSRASLESMFRIVYRYLCADRQTYSHIPPWQLPPLSDNGALVSSFLSMGIESFVVLHELSHIILGHIESDVGRKAVGPNSQLLVVCPNHQMEFDADRKAQELLFEVESRFPFVAAGGLCFLAMYLLVEEIGSKLSGVAPNTEESTSHPSPLNRIDRLRHQIAENLEGEAYSKTLGMYAYLKKSIEAVSGATISLTHQHVQIDWPSEPIVIEKFGWMPPLGTSEFQID